MTRHLPRDKRGALNPISGLPPTSAHTFTINIICTRTTGRAACREKIKRSQNCKQPQVELRCEFYLQYTNTEDLEWGCPAPRHETRSSEMCYPQPRLLLWPGVSPQRWRSSSLERPRTGAPTFQCLLQRLQTAHEVLVPPRVHHNALLLSQKQEKCPFCGRGNYCNCCSVK